VSLLGGRKKKRSRARRGGRGGGTQEAELSEREDETAAYERKKSFYLDGGRRCTISTRKRDRKKTRVKYRRRGDGKGAYAVRGEGPAMSRLA